MIGSLPHSYCWCKPGVTQLTKTTAVIKGKNIFNCNEQYVSNDFSFFLSKSFNSFRRYIESLKNKIYNLFIVYLSIYYFFLVPPALKSSSSHKQIKHASDWLLIRIVCKCRVHVKMTYYRYLSDPDELYVIRDCLKVARLFIGCEKIIIKNC